MGNISQIIVYERTREVYNFMMNGSKRSKEIVHYFTKKWTDEGVFEPEIGDIAKRRTIYNYIKRVKQTFLNFESQIETEKGRTLARLDDLYARSVKIQDYKGALAVLKEVNEIVGLKAPIKTETELTSMGEHVNRADERVLNEIKGIAQALYQSREKKPRKKLVEKK